MSNINFANPWLLLIALPLFAVVLVPFFITVRKDNVNGHNIASLCIHIVLCICFTLAISGMSYEAVITETNVYILADISYSTEHNIEDVQKSVEKVADKLPRNSKLGVICFGRNYQVVADMGSKVPDITKCDEVDTSATDIGAVLRYAGNLFDDDVIKRIVIVTDGVETVATNNIVTVVSALQDSGVYVDAVFIDDTLGVSDKELQIDSVEATSSTYLDKEEEVKIMVRANCGANTEDAPARIDGYVRLYRDDFLLEMKTASFYNGFNVVTMQLPTDEAGTYNYEVRVEAQNAESDTSPHNNIYYFSQKVSDERKVLFLGGGTADVASGRRIYGAEDVTYLTDPSSVPLSVEEMCIYDEIVLSNFDVRTIRANSMFMASLTTLVENYGKTLTTYGNTFIQDDDPEDKDSPLKRLSALLPVRVGNYDHPKRLVAIVLDVSISMNFSGRLAVAKRAAVELLNLMDTSDTVMVVGFSQVIDEFMPATQLTARNVIIEKIDGKKPENGTSFSGALEYTFDKMPTKYQDRQVIAITDALFYGSDASTSKAQVVTMCQNGITVSALGIYPSATDNSTLKNIIYNGYESDDAFYQRIEHESEIDVVMRDIGDEIQQVCIDEPGKVYDVTLRHPEEAVAKGVGNVGYVDGFWYSAAKTKATVTLSARYYSDKVTYFDVPVYASWSGGGKGKVVSFLSDIANEWTASWGTGTEGGKFLANIPDATLPDERIVTPFIVTIEGGANSTVVNVQTSTSLIDSTSFTATLTDPHGMVSSKALSFDSSEYFATFATDAPGVYSVHLSYAKGDLKYEMDAEFAISYYAEYDSFTSYSKSYLYRLLSDNGQILEVDSSDFKRLQNTDSEYTTYTLSFLMPLMIACVILFVMDIIIRQLRWKDITSFFSGVFRRRK